MRGRLWAIAGLIALYSTANGAVTTNQVGAHPASTEGSTNRPLNSTDLESWLDGLLPPALSAGGIAGAVVAVVKDGQVLLEKGYGYSDATAKTPVDPKTTLFRPGSISKTFTWTAVMQLVEAGTLDLDADINQYLDFKIPPRNGSKPITLRNLMTHTTGFEEDTKFLIVSDPTIDRSLTHAMKRWVPRRLFDAGTTPAYSNYGAALAGYIVQRVSKEPFEKYVEEHILHPLGMSHSTFDQPLPPDLAPLMSKGYPDISKPAEPFEFVTMAPAGSMSASGDDMAKFMIAQLHDGRYGETQIMKPETAATMHRTRTALMSPLNGIELGFYDQDLNDHRVISHGGDTILFHSGLWLFIDDDVGLYVSLNSAGVRAGALRQTLFEGFADRYFPRATHDPVVEAKTAAADAQLLAGNYQMARGEYTNFLRFPTLILAQIPVVANQDGTVSSKLLTKPSGEPRRYREIAPMVWRDVDGHDRLGAIVRDGRVARFSTDALSGVIVLDRVPASINAKWLLPAVVVSLAILLTTVIGWPIGAAVRARYTVPFPFAGRRAMAFRATRLAAITALLAVIGWIVIMMLFGSASGALTVYRSDWLIYTVEAVTILGFVGGFCIALFNLYVVFTSQTNFWSKLRSCLIVLSFLTLVWLALQGHMMNFSTQY